MKEIPISQGKTAIVDDEDYEKVNKWKWFYTNGYAKRTQYVGRSDGKDKNRTMAMHRLIVNCPKGLHVDHINHDKLDNRKENLRIVTHSQNHQNRKLASVNKSGVVGVFWSNQYNKWGYSLMVNRKIVAYGYYDDKEEAIRHRKEAEVEYGFHPNHGKVFKEG